MEKINTDCKLNDELEKFRLNFLRCTNRDVAPLMGWILDREFYFEALGCIASHADILLARHAIFPQRLRDEPKECLRGRLWVVLVCRALGAGNRRLATSSPILANC